MKWRTLGILAALSLSLVIGLVVVLRMWQGAAS